MNYVQIIEKNHIVEFTFRFVPISRLMHSKKKKKEIMLSKDHLDNSIGYRDIYIRNFHSN